MSRRKIEFGWHVAAFLLLMGAFVPQWRQIVRGEVGPVNGDPVMRALQAVAYLGVGLLIFHPRRSLSTVLRSPWLWTLLGWAFLSVTWSGAAGLSLRRAASALVAALYGLLLYVRYPFRSVLAMLGTALAIAVVASFGAALFFPDWGLMGQPHPGAWQGILFHKNNLGQISAIGVVIFALLYSGSKGLKRWIWAGLIVVALATLFFSRSATAIVLVVLLVLAWMLLILARRLPTMLQSALVSLGAGAAVLAALFLPTLLEILVETLGRGTTLTGRLPLWRILIPVALDRPLLGYGFGTFWMGWEGPSARVWSISIWDAAHAHNGYLDLWLDLGLIGLLLGIGLVMFTMVRAIRGNLARRTLEGDRFSFFLAICFVVLNFSESVLLESGLTKAFFWILFVYLYLYTLNARPTSLMPCQVHRAESGGEGGQN